MHFGKKLKCNTKRKPSRGAVRLQSPNYPESGPRIVDLKFIGQLRRLPDTKKAAPPCGSAA